MNQKEPSTGKNPTNAEILGAIQNSGYLLEQEIATILEKNNFHVETNKPFEDLETNKSREIDVYAIKRIFLDENRKLSIWVNILCECKNNSKPFVFIGRNKNERDKILDLMQFTFPIYHYDKPIKDKEDMFEQVPVINYLNLEDKYLFSRLKLKYVQFSKIVRSGKKWEANHSGIFDSILMPIIKAMIYFRKEYFNHKSWNNIVLRFPVVVLNSKLLAIDSTQKNYKLKSEKYVPLLREISSDNIKGKFVTDFTNKTNFQAYINEQIKFANAVKSIAEKNPDLLVKKSRKLR
ncbi:MAG: hypothetical protein KAQ83_00495 [Nanoarchaeota archaeon]|nr:hypothetical protein [Nanoarchaeota archaeon]